MQHNSSNTTYLPDYIVTPGDVLAEHLESIGMTQSDFSARTGMAAKTINEIIKGKAPITAESALKFERTLGRPAQFWSNMELRYREDILRLAEKERLEAHLGWMSLIPVRSMIKLGWIAEFKDKTMQLEELLRFFGIASPDRWNVVRKEYQAAFRKSVRSGKRDGAVLAWLRKGEVEASTLSCEPFDASRFRSILGDIRTLTTKTPEVFQPRLVELCASSGVAVVFVPELPGIGVYGATKWMGDKAVVQLSLRNKSNDQMWFNFFHEAGHILLHGRKAVFIEEKGLRGKQESEADDFACNKLIPLRDYTDFVATRQFTVAEIEAFAAEVGIAPGIVVGRLQHDELLPYNKGNKLKVFYPWSDEQC
jgi:HTH-type transcriptional regulator / antitoxin HigA